jgi:ribosomal protein S18 acetylase RimI-like enzyme
MDTMEIETKQKRRASEVMSAAFFDYPMMVHYFPDVKKRKRRLTWYMRRVLNSAVRYGKVYVSSDISGVLFMLPPDHTRLTTGEYIRCGFLLTPLVMGFRNYAASDECERFVADTHEKLMEGRRHYYLWGLVVEPEAQRKGVGTALMKIMTDTADAEKLPVYVETHDKNNIAFYERFGFKLIHTDTITKHGLEIWCMLREA